MLGITALLSTCIVHVHLSVARPAEIMTVGCKKDTCSAVVNDGTKEPSVAVSDQIYHCEFGMQLNFVLRKK